MPRPTHSILDTKRNHLSGDPATTLFALNCLLSAWLDAPKMIWLLARFHSRTRGLLATAVVILPLHAAFFVHAGLAFGKTVITDSPVSLTQMAISVQIVLYAMVAMDLPRRVQTWARECAGRNG